MKTHKEIGDKMLSTKKELTDLTQKFTDLCILYALGKPCISCQTISLMTIINKSRLCSNCSKQNKD